MFIQIPYHVLNDADRGENGTMYIEGNKTLISLNLSCKFYVYFLYL